MPSIINGLQEQLKIKMASLDALSPLSILHRGYSLTINEKGEILRNVNQTGKDENVQIRLANGKLKARVFAIEKE